MRTTRHLLILAALVAPAGGCNWMKEWRERDQVRDRELKRDVKNVTPEWLVAYLNDQAGRLQAIEYPKVSMRVSGKDLPIAANLDGDMLCAQPRNFRLVATGRVVSSKVILGSNPEEFWLYVAPPQDEPLYVHASHTDFDSGRARLPNDIPFEPNWVMQALGMTTFKPAPAVKYELTRPNPRDRDPLYTLSWPATTPTGTQVTKEILFDHDGGGNRPVVRKHVIRDARTRKVIASAEVKAVETAKIGVDSQGRPANVQYPTHVVLWWEEQDFKMDLTLRGGQVNQLDEQARQTAFVRPNIPGAKLRNLLRNAEFRSSAR